MGFFKRLLGGGQAADQGLYLYVRCDNCGEPIRIRVNLANDLSPVYEDEDDLEDGYELRKQILGNRCYKLMEGYWRFDRRKRPIRAEIEGGAQITAEEYEAGAAT